MKKKDSTGQTEERRGGRRQRNFAKKDGLGAIDREVLSDLLRLLAPTATDQQQEFALTIVIKGIELYREHAPSGRALTGSAQESRRALEKFKNGKTTAGIVPFSAKAPWGGYVSATDTGLHMLDGDTDDGGDQVDVYRGLDKAISGPLRTLSIMRQHTAGFKRINPNIFFNFNPSVVGNALLDEAVNPRDWDAELAGYVYLAIACGLSIRPKVKWYGSPPEAMRNGWNVGRLLEIAAAQAGAPLPSSRGGMEDLMARGMACAKEMLAPAGTFADGRTISLFEMEFPDR